MISQTKVQTNKKIQLSKVWYGNPQVELIEGTITYNKIKFLINKNFEHDYDENELESIKQYIWEINMKNDLIKTADLLCINVPNKISINEFLNTISIYLSYINIVRVFKSPIPNVYFVYLQMKNIEYANIIYNTFNYAKVNPIEKEYFKFVEIKEMKFDEFFYNELSYKNSKRLNGIKVLVSPSNKSLGEISKKVQNEIEINEEKHKLEIKDEDFDNVHFKGEYSNPPSLRDSYSQSLSRLSSKTEINLCSICLDQIELNNYTTTSLTSANGVIHVLCGHIFHIECSLKLDDDKCPMCRFNISPANVSSCSLCSCENDLWMCLICGGVNCGVEGGSNNHRKEHYLSTGHIYAKRLGDIHHVTFDFTKNAPLNILLQNSIQNQNSTQDLVRTYYSNNNSYSTDVYETNLNANDSLYFKDPKEKVQFIISEYNSIISSQLENQRLYYLNYMRKIDDKFKEEQMLIDKEIFNMREDLEGLNKESSLWSEKKKEVMEVAKVKHNEMKQLTIELNKIESEYKTIIREKESIEENKQKKQKQNFENLMQVENEIEELQNQIKDMKIHINTLNRIGKNKYNNNELSGGTIEFVADTGNNKKYKNHKKNK